MRHESTPKYDQDLLHRLPRAMRIFEIGSHDLMVVDIPGFVASAISTVLEFVLNAPSRTVLGSLERKIGEEGRTWRERRMTFFFRPMPWLKLFTQQFQDKKGEYG